MGRIAPGTLVGKAVERLRLGPAHTLDLAKVIGLRGHPGATAATIFTLLGTDPRFRVDPEGQWTLEEEGIEYGESLEALRYAVVDVETTGGSYTGGHRITEVAVVEVVEGLIGDVYQTLVNPGRSIPAHVSALTGITNDMVSVAPYFDEIAEDLLERLTGRVFVAHNVSFDWSFISSQLVEVLGVVPEEPRLCTVQMARGLLPHLRRRNLDAVSQHFEIPIEERHRARGDALATARVLIRLLDEAGARGLYDFHALKDFLSRGRKNKKSRVQRAGEGE